MPGGRAWIAVPKGALCELPNPLIVFPTKIEGSLTSPSTTVYDADRSRRIRTGVNSRWPCHQTRNLPPTVTIHGVLCYHGCVAQSGEHLKRGWEFCAYDLPSGMLTAPFPLEDSNG